jgi:hypothetical protein
MKPYRRHAGDIFNSKGVSVTPRNAHVTLPASTSASQHHITGAPIKGADYRPSCGNCQVPPWEVCDCSFNWAKQGLEAMPSKVEPVEPSHADLFSKEANERLQMLLAN